MFKLKSFFKEYGLAAFKWFSATYFLICLYSGQHDFKSIGIGIFFGWVIYDLMEWYEDFIHRWKSHFPYNLAMWDLYTEMSVKFNVDRSELKSYLIPYLHDTWSEGPPDQETLRTICHGHILFGLNNGYLEEKKKL